MQQLTNNTTTSRDGTRISYQETGHGPGLVIVHGSLSTMRNYSQLITLLAEHFTVYLYDRRGFIKDAQWQDFSLQKDIEDVAAVIKATKASNLFGYSLGAIIALCAAAALPEVRKLAVYEPPLFPTREAAEPVMSRLDQELAQHKIAAALVTAMVGAHLGSPWFNAMPRRLLEFMTKYMMTYGEKEGQGGYLSFRQLAQTLHHDGQVILEMSGKQDEFSRITAQTLLMGGSKSSKFLKNNLENLEKIIPQATRHKLPGLEHGSAQNSDMRGKPSPIAAALVDFFS